MSRDWISPALAIQGTRALKGPWLGAFPPAAPGVLAYHGIVILCSRLPCSSSWPVSGTSQLRTLELRYRATRPWRSPGPCARGGPVDVDRRQLPIWESRTGRNRPLSLPLQARVVFASFEVDSARADRYFLQSACTRSPSPFSHIAAQPVHVWELAKLVPKRAARTGEKQAVADRRCLFRSSDDRQSCRHRLQDGPTHGFSPQQPPNTGYSYSAQAHAVTCCSGLGTIENRVLPRAQNSRAPNLAPRRQGWGAIRVGRKDCKERAHAPITPSHRPETRQSLTPDRQAPPLFSNTPSKDIPPPPRLTSLRAIIPPSLLATRSTLHPSFPTWDPQGMPSGCRPRSGRPPSARFVVGRYPGIGDE